ncbi:transposase family protein [Kitasatospora sp. NPDC085879]|uniref:transposase family protein n=1 Tax=Kitasatospora sp. NPDC085879 TaxID=3154769 RepID=UPI00342E0D54
MGQLSVTAAPSAADPSGLSARLAAVPDPRRTQERRHTPVFVLALAACAVPAGARSLAAITKWAADAPPKPLLRPGGGLRDPDTGPAAPRGATVRRVLQRVDGDALDAAIGAWSTDRAPLNSPDQLWPWTARPCAGRSAPTAPRSSCRPR